MIDDIFTGVAIMVATSIIAVIAKHITNTDRHVSKDDVVFKNEYEAKHIALKESIEEQVNALDEKFDMVRQDLKDACVEIKQMIKDLQ